MKRLFPLVFASVLAFALTPVVSAQEMVTLLLRLERVDGDTHPTFGFTGTSTVGVSPRLTLGTNPNTDSSKIRVNAYGRISDVGLGPVDRVNAPRAGRRISIGDAGVAFSGTAVAGSAYTANQIMEMVLEMCDRSDAGPCRSGTFSNPRFLATRFETDGDPIDGVASAFLHLPDLADLDDNGAGGSYCERYEGGGPNDCEAHLYGIELGELLAITNADSYAGDLVLTPRGPVEQGLTRLDDETPDVISPLTVELCASSGCASRVAFNAATLTVNEAAGEALVTLSLPTAPMEAGIVTIAATPGTGLDEGTEYTVPATLVIPAGAREAVLAVGITDDILPEGTETLTLTLSSVSGGIDGLGLIATATLVITDVGEDLNLVSVAFGDVMSGAEGGTATVTVTVTNVDSSASTTGPQRQVTIPITLMEAGGATEADFSGVPGTITLAGDQTALEIPIEIVDDTDMDSGESVVLSFGSPSHPHVSTGPPVIVALTDDDSDRVVVDLVDHTQNAVTVIEGGGADATVTATMRVVVELGTPLTTSEPVTLEVELPPPPPGSPIAHETATATIVLMDGDQNVTLFPGPEVVVTASPADAGDGVVERQEPFRLPTINTDVSCDTPPCALDSDSIAGVNGMDGAGGPVVGDRDQAEGSIAVVSSPGIMEGNVVEFAVSLNMPVDQTVTASWSVSVNPEDVVNPTGTVMFLPKSNAGAPAPQPVSVMLRDDNLNEGDETIEVTLLTLESPDPGVNARVTVGSTDSATYLIGANDPIAVSLTGPETIRRRDADGRYTVSLGGGVSADEAVTVTVRHAGVGPMAMAAVYCMPAPGGGSCTGGDYAVGDPAMAANVTNTLGATEDVVVVIPPNTSAGTIIVYPLELASGADKDDKTFHIYAHAVGALSSGNAAIVTSAATVTTTIRAVDPAQQAKRLQNSLAGFLRVIGTESVDVIGGRRHARDTLSGSYLNLGGEELKLADFEDEDNASRVYRGLHAVGSIVGVDLPEPVGKDAAFADDDENGMEHYLADTLRPWANRDLEDADLIELRRIDAKQFLSQSSFEWALSGTGAEGASVWGRGSFSGFEGVPEEGFTTDGEVVGWHVGADFRWRESILAGLAIANHTSDVDFADADGEGTVEASLTSLQPYVHWTPRQGLNLWGMVGVGQGEADMTVDDEKIETDIEMRMAALGVRNELQKVGNFDLAVKGDAFAIMVEGDAVADTIDKSEANIHRARVALEGTRSWERDSGSKLSSILEVGARVDGGDAEEGGGLEVGGGLSYVSGPKGMEFTLRGRYLVTHAESDFEDWGLSVGASYDPETAGRGLTFSLAPTWGNSGSQVENMWESSRAFGAGQSGDSVSGVDSGSMDLEVGYGFGMRRALLTPYGELSLGSQDRRRLRLGTRLEFSDGPGAGSAESRSLLDTLTLEVYGEQAAEAESTENRIGITGGLDF